MVIVSETLVFLGSRLYFTHHIFGKHAVTESLQKLEKVFEMNSFPIGDCLTWDVIEVIVDDFGDKINDPLYFLTSTQSLVLAETEEMDNGLREYDFAYLKVYLLTLEYLDFLNPPPNAYVLEDVDGNVDDGRFTWPLT